MNNTKIEYRAPCCGGIEVFGSVNCQHDESGNWLCHCTKQIQHNYHLWYAIVQVKEYSDLSKYNLINWKTGSRSNWY